MPIRDYYISEAIEMNISQYNKNILKKRKRRKNNEYAFRIVKYIICLCHSYKLLEQFVMTAIDKFH